MLGRFVKPALYQVNTFGNKTRLNTTLHLISFSGAPGEGGCQQLLCTPQGHRK